MIKEWEDKQEFNLKVELIQKYLEKNNPFSEIFSYDFSNDFGVFISGLDKKKDNMGLWIGKGYFEGSNH